MTKPKCLQVPSAQRRSLPPPLFNVLLLFAFLHSGLSAQMQMNLRLVYDDSVKVAKYEPLFDDFKYKTIRLDAGDYRIDNPTVPTLLNQETITGVDLVYTDYPPGEDLRELNRKRLLELYMYCPNAFNHSVVRWRVVKQTGVKSKTDLSRYFHGFVIYYRPLIPFLTEKSYFQKVMTEKVVFQDSTLLKVFARNKHWKQMICVTDVTGSMSPYTTQLLAWLKYNEQLQTFKQFVFFNDDDEASNDQTKALDSLGIWSLESTNADKILNKMLFAMSHGSHYENNLEAIFYAVKKYPGNIKNIVMIADNWEDPCDMFLLPKLKALNIPIRIIICGVNSVLNKNYLDIAYATNGSVHTMEEDLIEMGNMSSGRTFTLSGLKFKLVGNRFIEQE